MNLRKEKTVITVENYRRVATSLRSITLRARCADCNAVSQMISPDNASTLLKTTVREIFRRIEAGEFHFSETTSGALLVCRSSVSEGEAQNTF